MPATTTTPAPTPAAPPLDETLTITATMEGGLVHVYQFHVYQGISIRDEIEVSRMANRGGGSIAFNHGRMPTVVSGTIECKGGLAVPDLRRHVGGFSGTQFQYYTQRITSGAQRSILDALIGKIVTIDCRGTPPGGVKGLLREGTKRPDLEYDDGLFFDFEIYQDPPQSTTSLGAFGDINVVFVPSDSGLPGDGTHDCKTVTKTSHDVTVLGTLISFGVAPILGTYFFATSDDPGVGQARKDFKDIFQDAGHSFKHSVVDMGKALREAGKETGQGLDDALEDALGKPAKDWLTRWDMKGLEDKGLVSRRKKTAEVCS